MVGFWRAGRSKTLSQAEGRAHADPPVAQAAAGGGRSSLFTRATRSFGLKGFGT